MSRECIAANASLISKAVTRWGRQNYVEYPWRKTENRWLSLVGELMLQRTRASAVYPVWLDFAERYPSPVDVLSQGQDALWTVMKPLGLSWRIPLVWNLAEKLAAVGEVPSSKDELLKLPGIGDYAASAYLSLHRNRRAVIVDANVVRWLCRMTGEGWDGETRRKAWLRELADTLTPTRIFKNYNYAALDLTMTVCKKNPECAICPVKKFCVYAKEHAQVK